MQTKPMAAIDTIRPYHTHSKLSNLQLVFPW